VHRIRKARKPTDEAKDDEAEDEDTSPFQHRCVYLGIRVR
jgi:hypothetical protein